MIVPYPAGQRGVLKALTLQDSEREVGRA